MIGLEKHNRAIDELQGDLLAISLLLDKMRSVGTMGNVATKKLLWNARSRLITRVANTIGISNPNSIESIIVRELIGLASKVVEEA